MVMRTMLKSKIHRARVTEGNINYEGSITIDKLLLEAADIFQYEKVEVLDINNGTRLTTYAIEGEKASGQICLNGAAARLIAKDDIIIILSYHDVTDEEAAKAIPRIVHVDSLNRIVDVRGDRDRARHLVSTI
jgi:aspartate 1-decarboxylase